MPRYVDSHCHLDFPAFEPDRMKELAAMQVAGVMACVVPGISRETWPRVQQLAQSAEGVFAAYGLHPYFLDQHQRSDIEALARQIESDPVVAVGEFGLDYFIKNSDREEQQYYFEAQLDLARQRDLPVILHVRKAHNEVLKALRQVKLPRGGVIHAYSGSEQQAQQYIELGFCLGFGGSVTYDRALKLRRLVGELPLESILLETDAPDMPPSFIERGELNRPSYLPRIAQTIAEQRQISLSALAEATTANADRLFRLNIINSD